MVLCDEECKGRNALAPHPFERAVRRARRNGRGVFFYHPDHLGSTSYVTDADGNIAQHVEYIPYGEVFVEERNSQFSTNYLFNAKELDNETGLYYYGARYLDPTGAMWLSVDPMWEKYMGISPYAYCMGNPVKYVDPDGNIIETLWDAANVTMGVVSCAKNIAIGNYVGAAVDAGGVVADLAATVLPGVPGGAGTAIRAARAADKGYDIYKGIKTADKVADASKMLKSADKAADAAKSTKTALTNEQIVQKAANKAEKAIGGTGHVAGTKKHKYAGDLIERYQKMYGDKGLRVNDRFENKMTKERGILDVRDETNKVIYDFKFGKAGMGSKQFKKYHNQYQDHSIKVVRPDK